MTWKLPEHLEPYREYINIGDYFSSVEDAYSYCGFESSKGFCSVAVHRQIELLENLYKERFLK